MTAPDLTPAAFALAEYARRHEAATIEVANRRLTRDRAERSCRAWLSLLLRLGGSHPHAQPLIDDLAQAAPDWPASTCRAYIARELCPTADLVRHLEHAAASAFAVALGHDGEANAAQQPAWARFTTLRRLCTQMGSNAPIKFPDREPNRKAA